MIRSSIRPRPARRAGNVLALVAIFLTGLVGMVAFAIDTGYIAMTKTRLQRAADACALAGAQAALVPPGETQNPDTVRAEVRKYLGFNYKGLTVRDEDVVLARYIHYYAPEDRLSYTYSATSPANCVRVTLRRDGLANNPLGLFFAPVIGTRDVSLAVSSFAYMSKAKGVKSQAPLLPYTMQIDYYYAAMGQARTGIDGQPIDVADDQTVAKTGTGYSVIGGPDGVNEVHLFSHKINTNGKVIAPGNFGSLDLGSSLNATGELERQILYGPTDADFANPDFIFKLAADGSLVCPFDAGGDSGLSTSVKTSFEAILGQPRIIPLYDTVSSQGDSVTYHIVGYAGVVITSVNFTGNPKGVWVQPAFLAPHRVTPMTSDTDGVTEGVYTPPKLVIP